MFGTSASNLTCQPNRVTIVAIYGAIVGIKGIVSCCLSYWYAEADIICFHSPRNAVLHTQMLIAGTISFHIFEINLNCTNQELHSGFLYAIMDVHASIDLVADIKLFFLIFIFPILYIYLKFPPKLTNL